MGGAGSGWMSVEREYIAGLDIGKLVDFSAFALFERSRPMLAPSGPEVVNDLDELYGQQTVAVLPKPDLLARRPMSGALTAEAVSPGAHGALGRRYGLRQDTQLAGQGVLAGRGPGRVGRHGAGGGLHGRGCAGCRVAAQGDVAGEVHPLHDQADMDTIRQDSGGERRGRLERTQVGAGVDRAGAAG